MSAEDPRVEQAREAAAGPIWGPSDVGPILSDLLAAYDELWTWGGLLSILDKHYPADIFPTLPDRVDRDPGPRIVSLIRALSAAGAERDKLRVALADECRDIARSSTDTAKAIGQHRELVAELLIKGVGSACDCAPEGIVAERDRLAAAVERVRAEVDSTNADPLLPPEAYQLADTILAALAGPTEDTGSGDRS